MRSPSANLAAVLVLTTVHQKWHWVCSAESIQTIAFGSCNKPEQVSLWPQLSTFEPQSLILLGDTMYADKRGNMPGGPFIAATPDDIIAKYKLVTDDRSFSNMLEGLGGWNRVAATFDDHDFGINNGDSSYAYINQSQQLFWNFTQEPIDSYRRKQSGVYSSKQYIIDVKSRRNSSVKSTFTYKIVMLDTRSNRDVAKSMFDKKDINYGDFLGEQQWSWLEKELDSDADLILLGSSIQVMPTGKLTEELWEMFPSARMRLISLILGSTSPNILLLSGDVHYAEVSKMNCNWREVDTNTGSPKSEDKSSLLWELTSSGLTHTFYRNSPYKTDPRAEVMKELDDASELWPALKAFFYNIYQASAPSHYRENRFGDHYSGLNFGLLDINIDDVEGEKDSLADRDMDMDMNGQCVNTLEPSDNSSASQSSTCDSDLGVKISPLPTYSVTFRVMNHFGQAVITKKIPLRNKNEYRVSPGRIENLVCVPFWGAVPSWRLVLMYFMVALPLVAIFGTALALLYISLKFIYRISHQI